MATYTMTIRDMLMDYVSNYEGLTRNQVQMLNTNELISLGQKYIFDFPYPLLEEHKNRIEQKFLFTYFMSEIGLETPALFKHYLQANLMLISGKYNMMYKLFDKEIDPFINYDYTEKGERDVDDTSTGNSKTIANALTNTTDKGTNTYNNEGGIKNWNIPADKQVLYDNDDATSSSANKDKSNTETTNTGKTDSKSDGSIDTSSSGKSHEKSGSTKHGMIGVNVVDIIIKYQNEIFDVDMQLLRDRNITKNLMSIF